MPNESRVFTLEDLTSGALAPWFSGESIAAGDRVATPKEAAAKAVLAALNSPDGVKGRVRILVTNAEDKRLVKNYLDAFLQDVPDLKRTVRKVAQDGTVSLHGGVSLVIDMNEARLAKDAIATIILDAVAGEVIDRAWIEPEDTEDQVMAKRQARATLRGCDVRQIGTVRWHGAGEGETEVIPVSEDGRQEAGPPREDAHRASEDAHRDPDPDPVDAAVAEQRYREAVERLEREHVNERLAEGYRKISGGFA